MESRLLIENLNFRFSIRVRLLLWMNLGKNRANGEGLPIFGLIDVFLINLNEIHAELYV